MTELNDGTSVNTIYPCVIFQIQTIKIEIDTGTMNNVLQLVNRLTGILAEGNRERLSSAQIIQRTSREEIKEEEDYKKQDICEALEPADPISPELSLVSTNKQYYEFLNLGAMKLIISIKIQKKEVFFDPKAGLGVLTVLYSVLAGALTISDSPLSFKEQVHKNVFKSQAQLQSCLLYTSPSPRDKRQSRMPSSA